MAFDKKKFIGKFVEEAQDHLAKMNEGFLTLEKNPSNSETLNEVFRSAHTIKGSSKILSLNEIGELAHGLEDTLDSLREGKIPTSKELFNILFNAVDTLNEMTDLVQNGQEVTIDSTQLRKDLENAAAGNMENPPSLPVASNEIPANTAIDISDPGNLPNVPKQNTTEPHEKVGTKSNQPDTNLSKKLNLIPPPKNTQSPTGTVGLNRRTIDESFRIQTKKLDQAIKLSGEIVSVHSHLTQHANGLEEIGRQYKDITSNIIDMIRNQLPESTETVTQIATITKEFNSKIKKLSTNLTDSLNMNELLTGDLREKILGMRMQPISTILESFPRMIRDMSTSSGKQVDLILEGGETELDKKILERIKAPLMHIVRNCFDHGIEASADREKVGKPLLGRIKVSAYYEGGIVLIEVNDDGGGIQLEKIKEKALKKKMFDALTLDAMSKEELTNIIFEAGFSTVSIITDVSGRGVGMDVVRENIVEHLRGSIHIDSNEGEGTRFLIRLPITLAIMPVLFVSISSLKVAIAVSAVSEVLKVEKIDLIEVVDKKAIRHREQIIPIFELDKSVQFPSKKPNSDEEISIMILIMGSEKLGLVIDSLVGEELIEITPVPSHMKNNDLIAGATVAGEEDVILLLHVPRIFSLAKENKNHIFTHKNREANENNRRILVIDDSVNTREIEKSILESYGYEVELAFDGQDGLEKAREFNFDLVVTDVEMPRLDGFSLTEKLRQEKSYEKTPIIIVTSRDKEEDKRRGIRVGADAYIVKGSFEQSNLLSTVQNLI